MGYKKVCIPCRKSFSREKIIAEESMRKFSCPNCGKEMVLVGHRFRPPRKDASGKWSAVEYLLTHGFNFGEWPWEKAPETKREAMEFVERWKGRRESGLNH